MNYFVGNLKTRIHLHFPYDFALLPSLREKLKIINLLKIQIIIINYKFRAGSVLVVVDCIPSVSPHDYSIH